MSANGYWFDEGVLTIEDGSGTELGVAGLQDITVTPSATVEQQYTGDSTKIDAQREHEHQVTVDIGYTKWSEEALTYWLSGDPTTSDPVEWADSSIPNKFDATLEVTDTGGNTTTAEVTGITFEEFPFFDGSRGEFVQLDISGIGETFTLNPA